MSICAYYQLWTFWPLSLQIFIPIRVFLIYIVRRKFDVHRSVRLCSLFVVVAIQALDWIVSITSFWGHWFFLQQCAVVNSFLWKFHFWLFFTSRILFSPLSFFLLAVSFLCRDSPYTHPFIQLPWKFLTVVKAVVLNPYLIISTSGSLMVLLLFFFSFSSS